MLNSKKFCYFPPLLALVLFVSEQQQTYEWYSKICFVSLRRPQLNFSSCESVFSADLKTNFCTIYYFFSLKMIQVSDFELNSIILQRKYIFKFKFQNFRPKIVEILAHKKNARSTLYRHFIYCRQQQQQNFSKPKFAFSRSAIFRIFEKFS